MKKVFLSLLCAGIGIGGSYAQDKTAPAMKPIPSAPGHMAPSQQAATPGAATAAPAAPDPDAGKFKFKELSHDYGEVMEGPLAECDFTFKNVGKKPIIISEAHGSCGCTVPKWPSDPILPKHSGTIHVTYNTAGRVGAISKDVYITSNAQQNPMRLHISGVVKAKPDAKKPDAPVPPAPKN